MKISEMEFFMIYDVGTDNLVPLSQDRFESLLDGEHWLMMFVTQTRKSRKKLPPEIATLLAEFEASRPFKNRKTQ